MKLPFGNFLYPRKTEKRYDSAIKTSQLFLGYISHYWLETWGARGMTCYIGRQLESNQSHCNHMICVLTTRLPGHPDNVFQCILLTTYFHLEMCLLKQNQIVVSWTPRWSQKYLSLQSGDLECLWIFTRSSEFKVLLHSFFKQRLNIPLHTV